MQNVICGIAGMKGYGKSTYLQQLLQNDQCLALIDTLGEHSSWCPECPERNIAAQVRALASPPEKFRWSFRLPPGKAASAFNFLARAAYMAGEMTFAVEEIDYFSSANADEEGTELLVRYGRHRRVDLVWLTRNITDVSRRLTSQTDCYVFFRIQEPRYIESLGDRIGYEVAEEVAVLPKFHYLVCTRDDGVIKRGVVSPNGFMEAPNEQQRQDDHDPAESEEGGEGTEAGESDADAVGE